MKIYIFYLPVIFVILTYSAAPRVPLVFYQEESGNEPVRAWLRELPKNDRQVVGEDLAYLQENWGKDNSIAKRIESGEGLWEVKSNLESCVSRVIFKEIDGKIVVLNAFIKKRNTTRVPDIALAVKRSQTLKNISK
jgi:phage-related protein